MATGGVISIIAGYLGQRTRMLKTDIFPTHSHQFTLCWCVSKFKTLPVHRLSRILWYKRLSCMLSLAKTRKVLKQQHFFLLYNLCQCGIFEQDSTFFFCVCSDLIWPTSRRHSPSSIWTNMSRYALHRHSHSTRYSRGTVLIDFGTTAQQYWSSPPL